MSRDERMPPDPFADADDVSALGAVGDVLAEAHLLMDALREADARGRLLDAVVALSVGDLRAVVLERLIAERLRRAFRDPEEGQP